MTLRPERRQEGEGKGGASDQEWRLGLELVAVRTFRDEPQTPPQPSPQGASDRLD